MVPTFISVPNLLFVFYFWDTLDTFALYDAFLFFSFLFFSVGGGITPPRRASGYPPQGGTAQTVTGWPGGDLAAVLFRVYSRGTAEKAGKALQIIYDCNKNIA